MSLLRKPWFYLTAIFLAGLLAGGFLGIALAKRQIMQPIKLDRIGHQVEKELTSKLRLNAAQQTKLRPLINETMARINGIFLESLQKIDAALLDAQNALVADLRPEQIERLSTVAKDRQDFIRQHSPLTPPLESSRQAK